jgi:formylmethanofuran dehydrogenase subunit E
MHTHGDEYTKSDILSILQENPTAQPDIDWFSRCIDFHSHAAPGLLIGVYMVDYALSLLQAQPTEKLYAICETPKCLPDALQVIAHCTSGNNRLRIFPIGRFAMTMNRFSADSVAEGVRVGMDPSTLKDTPALDAWFANSPKFDMHSMKKQVVDEILKKGRNMLFYEKVRIPIIQKEKWETGFCSVCHEPVPSYMLEDEICPGCGSLKYCDKIE